ncbi:MAG: putative Ig domain-containing protein [Rubripirellula sp.]|nr:putative Ig domain-containing protein [Rubripirellula sp.]
MPIRITILSGDRQGQQLEFDREAIEIGDQPSDDISFDVTANPGIRDRRVTLKWQNGGWSVVCGSVMPIFLNQDLVEDSADLKSGDFLRMSHEGPDLSCEFISKLSPIATVKPASRDTASAPANPASVSPTPAPVSPTTTTSSASAAATRDPFPAASEPASAADPEPSGSPRFSTNQIFAAVGTLGFLIVVMLGTQWAASRTSKPQATRPSLVPFGVLVVKEGKQLFWRPTLTQADSRDRFSLDEDAPPTMTIDEATGTIRWQTTESDGPGEYRCQLTVRRGDASEQQDSQWLEIKVDEINRPPEPETVPVQTVNLLEQQDFSITLTAKDADLPAQALAFRLGAGAPEGAQLDPNTGVLTWRIDDQSANREITIPYQVDDGSGEQGTQGLVRIRVIKPDPWQVAETQLRDCIYLVVTETIPGKLLVPLGTACAIDDNRLLTTASVAHGINDARGRGWKVFAADTRNLDLIDPQGIEIEEVQTHAAYLKAESIQNPQQRGLQQAFFDLAILSTKQSLPNQCTLAELEKTVKKDQTVACFGFAIEGESLSQFDSLDPQFTKIKLLDVVPPPNESGIQGRPPFLLQLLGDLPFQPFGSVVVNQQGELLGIYAFEGEIPKDIDSEPVHYAVESVHAQAYLSQRGLDLWIKTEPIKPRDENP